MTQTIQPQSPSAPAVAPSSAPALTVAICAHNAAARIPMVLDSIATTTPDPALTWELLIIDNASTDATASISRALCEKHRLPYRILTEPQPGLANARRLAALEARAEFLCFLDDDNIVPPDYVRATLDFLRQHPNTAVVGALVEPVFEDPAARPANFQEHFAGLLSMYDLGPTPKRLFVPQDPSPVGAGMAGRTDFYRLAFDTIGSLSIGRTGKSLAGGEDYEAILVGQLMGWEIWYNPAMRLGHFVPTRKLTGDYRTKWMIDTCRCHAWLRILWGEYPRPTRAACRRKVLNLRFQGYAWAALALLPKRLHPKLADAKLWSKMMFSMADGWHVVYANYPRVQRTFDLIASHKLSTTAPA